MLLTISRQRRGSNRPCSPDAFPRRTDILTGAVPAAYGVLLAGVSSGIEAEAAVARMNTPTQVTLLERLREASDPLAWDEFYRRYWRLIFSTARRRGCSDHTAEEIVQEAMLAVFRGRDAFRYDPSRGRFRDWLGTVVRNAVAARRRSPADRARPLADDAPLAAITDDAATPDVEWQRQFDLATLASLLDVVQHEVTPATFQAFELAVLHEMPGADVARVTGLSRNAVYLARRRILRRLVELGAHAQPAAALAAKLREALRDAPRPAVERAVTIHVEQTILPARTDDQGTAS
jgi:RNA polymerase sigma factor (sigma-70 family)